MGDKIFEEIKEKYEKSNKYILYVSYEDIGKLISIIEIINKRKNEDYIEKKKIKEIIKQYKDIRNIIIKNESKLNRSMITYDLIRNDYCEKILESLLRKGE